MNVNTGRSDLGHFVTIELNGDTQHHIRVLKNARIYLYTPEGWTGSVTVISDKDKSYELTRPTGQTEKGGAE